MATIAPTSPLQTLTTGISSFIGGYGSGLAKLAPMGLASQALAGNQQAYNNAFQSSFNYLANSSQQAQQQRFQAQQAQLATDRAFQLQDRRDLANVNEISMRQTGRPEVGMGTPGAPDYIPGWKDGYDNYVSSLEGPPQDYGSWKTQQVQALQKQQTDAAMAEKGMTWGIAPEHQAWNSKVDQEIADFQANPPAGYGDAQRQQHLSVLQGRKFQPGYYKPGPSQQQQIQESVAPIMGPNNQLMGYASANGIKMNYLPQPKGGGSDGGSSGPASKGESVMDDITGGISLEAAKRNYNAAQASMMANSFSFPDRPGVRYIRNPKTGAITTDDTVEKLDLQRKDLEIKEKEAYNRQREAYAKEYGDLMKEYSKNMTPEELARKAQNPGPFGAREIDDRYKYADFRMSQDRMRGQSSQMPHGSGGPSNVDAIKAIANGPPGEAQQKAQALLDKFGIK